MIIENIENNVTEDKVIRIHSKEPIVVRVQSEEVTTASSSMTVEEEIAFYLRRDEEGVSTGSNSAALIEETQMNENTPDQTGIQKVNLGSAFGGIGEAAVVTAADTETKVTVLTETEAAPQAPKVEEKPSSAEVLGLRISEKAEVIGEKISPTAKRLKGFYNRVCDGLVKKMDPKGELRAKKEPAPLTMDGIANLISNVDRVMAEGYDRGSVSHS